MNIKLAAALTAATLIGGVTGVAAVSLSADAPNAPLAPQTAVAEQAPAAAPKTAEREVASSAPRAAQQASSTALSVAQETRTVPVVKQTPAHKTEAAPIAAPVQETKVTQSAPDPTPAPIDPEDRVQIGPGTTTDYGTDAPLDTVSPNVTQPSSPPMSK